MAFLDDLGNKINKTGQAAVKKSKELAGTAKYEAQIYAEQKVLDSLNTKMANACCEAIASSDAIGNLDITFTPEMLDIYRDIMSAKERIADLNAEIERIKNELQ
ncbi:MAG: hypothetical protein LUH40_06420 [Clostridiales bacterium]|nr:hypothetical protein [Clostridiales bacterium]